MASGKAVNRIPSHQMRVIIVASICVAMCAASLRAQSTDALSRKLVLADLAVQLREWWIHLKKRSGSSMTTPHAFFADSVVFANRRSLFVRGLGYTWGFFRPPRTGDILLQSVAARSAGGAKIIKSPADWHEIVPPSWWSRLDDSTAVVACAEMISVVGPRRGLSQPPAVFYSDESLNALPAYLRDTLRKERLRPPVLTKSSHDAGFGVELWAVEERITTRYRCQVNVHSAELLAIDSIPNVGFLGLSP